MNTLPRRIAALEQASPDTSPMTIIRRIVCPGQLDAEVSYARDTHGREWTRQPGETEDAFTDRAAGETEANACGIKRLIASSAEGQHAES